MTPRPCPTPDCENPVPGKAVFCPDCHFRIPPNYTRAVFRMKFECERSDDDDRRAYLRKQLTGYINVAILHMKPRRQPAVRHG